MRDYVHVECYDHQFDCPDFQPCDYFLRRIDRPGFANYFRQWHRGNLGAIGHFEYSERKLCLYAIDRLCDYIYFECDDHKFSRSDIQPCDYFLRRIDRSDFANNFGQWNRGNLESVCDFKYGERKLCLYAIDRLCDYVHVKCDDHKFDRADFQFGDVFLRGIDRPGFANNFRQWDRGNLESINHFEYGKRKLCLHAIDRMRDYIYLECDDHKFDRSDFQFGDYFLRRIGGSNFADDIG